VRIVAGTTQLALTILGYQFPEIEHDRWDSNWLMIRLDVRAADDAWTMTDPGLVTFEVEALVTWLRAVADANGEVATTLTFVEPLLRFEAVPARRQLLVDAGYGRLRLELPVDAAVLRSWSVQLEHQLQRFPRRGAAR
jgi:hypothetical protein